MATVDTKCHSCVCTEWLSPCVLHSKIIKCNYAAAVAFIVFPKAFDSV